MSDANDRSQPRRRELSIEDLESLNRELAALARAGAPMEPGLRRLAGAGTRTARLLGELADQLEQGVALEAALGRLPSRLPVWYQAVATAGVRAGALGEVLLSVGSHISKQVHWRKRLVEAMWYPMILVVVCFVLLAGAIHWTHPRIVATLEDIGAAEASDLPIDPLWFWLPGAIAVGLLLAAWLWARYTVTGERVLWRVPVVGDLCRRQALARFFDLLTVLIRHETPMGEAVMLAADASGSRYLAEQIARSRRLVDAGGPVEQTIEQWPGCAGFAAWLVGQAQRDGRLADGLAELAEQHADAAEDWAQRLIAIAPMLTVIGVGVVIGLAYVRSMWLPFTQLLDRLSGA